MATSIANREIVAKTTKLTVKNNMPDILSAIQKNLSRASYASMTVVDAYQATQIPIDTSALANNRTIENTVEGEYRVKCILRFNQDYAAAVHEKVGVNWQRPAAVDHWLANAAKESKDNAKKMFDDVIKGAV